MCIQFGTETRLGRVGVAAFSVIQSHTARHPKKSRIFEEGRQVPCAQKETGPFRVAGSLTWTIRVWFLHVTNASRPTMAFSQPAPYTLHPTPYTTHPTPYALHPHPYTLHPTLYTTHPTPYIYTLTPTPYTLHPTPCTLYPTPYALWQGDWPGPRRTACRGC